jgi:3-keto-5-aminohexanoate cleavage enzyme
MQKLIVTCAITGGLHGKAANPNIPEQPEEQIQQTIDAWNAGASIVHIHARNEKGISTQDVARYREIFEGIRARGCDVVLQATTGGGIGMTKEERLQSIDAGPEMASLNMGIINYPLPSGTGYNMSDNTPADIAWYAEKMKAKNVKPEMEVYNLAMMKDVDMLIQKGLLVKPYYVSFVMRMPAQNTLEATRRNLFIMVDSLPPDSVFNVCALGPYQLPMTTFSILEGGMARVGMEDNIYYRRGEKAKSNAQLVERTVRIARELQREIATPEEARQILNINPLKK